MSGFQHRPSGSGFQRGGRAGSRGPGGESRHGNPLDLMANLFDVSILLAVGFLVVALTSFGLKEIISGEDVTIVKNPGGADMEIIMKKGDTVERLKNTGTKASGQGNEVGKVYKLQDGSMIWVPIGENP